MEWTAQLHLLPDAEQAARLRETVERFNRAADWLSGIAFGRRKVNRVALGKVAYRALRGCFQLPADTAARCLAQVCAAVRRDQLTRPPFRPHAPVPFQCGKNLSFRGADRVSISTLGGRVIVPFVKGDYLSERFGFAKGQRALVLRGDGEWFLLAPVGGPEAQAVEARALAPKEQSCSRG